MKLKYLFVLLFAVSATGLPAQKIIISGEETSRPLRWSDFTGKPDDSNPYFALTYWNISYKYTGVQFNGDQAVVTGFEATLQLDPKGSWLKKGKGTDELLKHEQGHFDAARLCLAEILKKMAGTSFTRTGYQSEIQRLNKETIKKYVDMNVRYDNETNHSANKQEQQKWDAFFEKELKKSQID